MSFQICFTVLTLGSEWKILIRNIDCVENNDLVVSADFVEQIMDTGFDSKLRTSKTSIMITAITIWLDI